MSPFLGVILTGGAARRMGGAKLDRRLPGGRRLIDAAAASVRAAGPAAMIAVGAPPGGGTGPIRTASGPLEVVPDARPGEGPLAGLATALAAARARDLDRVLIVPCDMPWLVAADLERLLAAPAPIVHPDTGGLPLAADVTDALAAAVDAALVAGRRRLRDLLEQSRATVLTLDEPARRRHANVNRPEDLRPGP